MGTTYGYARTSTEKQNLESQKRALKEAGCEIIITEQRSGKNMKDRKKFQELLERMEAGDVLIVSKLDRFARSTKDALTTIDDLTARGIGIIVLNMGGMKIDTTDKMGRLLVIILSGVAEFELELMKERQREGIEIAKKNGLYKGRPERYTEKNPKLVHALKLFNEREENGYTVKQISDITGISRSTIYEKLKTIQNRRHST